MASRQQGHDKAHYATQVKSSDHAAGYNAHNHNNNQFCSDPDNFLDPHNQFSTALPAYSVFDMAEDGNQQQRSSTNQSYHQSAMMDSPRNYQLGASEARLAEVQVQARLAEAQAQARLTEARLR
jgi:hypothetical protein